MLEHGAVEQLGGAVDALRIMQLRQIEDELGLQLRRRQTVAGKGVEMRGKGAADGHCGPIRITLASNLERSGRGVKPPLR